MDMNDDGYALCVQLAGLTGRLRILDDADKEMVKRIAGQRELWSTPRYNPPGVQQRQGPVLELAVTETAAGVIRRVAYKALTEQRPDLYSRYVTEKPPDHPFTYRMNSGSREWGRAKFEAAERELSIWKPLAWYGYDDVTARRLFAVRSRYRTLMTERDTVRDRLAALAEHHGWGLALTGRVDGVVSLIPVTSTRRCDVDAALKTAEMVPFISESIRAAGIRVWFRPVPESADFEGDQPAE
jgi:hypothetical protein